MAGPLPNRKHEIFAVELATGAPLLSAYLTAGYKPGYSARFNASRLRNKPHLKARIHELFEAAAEHAVVQIGWIQHRMIDIIEGKAESCIRVGEDGKRVVEMDRLAALNSLAKTIGGFVARAELSGPGGQPIQTKDPSAMRPAELAARISWLIEEAAKETATAEPAHDRDLAPSATQSSAGQRG